MCVYICACVCVCVCFINGLLHVPSIASLSVPYDFVFLSALYFCDGVQICVPYRRRTHSGEVTGEWQVQQP